jgi:parallel beta-helix repeat protein
VTLTNCTVSGNEAYYSGGIYNDGTLTLTGCIVSDNAAVQDGAGIYNYDTLTMTGCTVSLNKAGFYGGGIYNESGTATLTNCTVSDNEAISEGAGIYNVESGTVNLTNCTVSGNKANSEGGGISNEYGDMTLINCTISDNEASVGGGIYNSDTLTLTCTIVYGNTASAPNYNIYGSYTDVGENIVDEPPGSAPDPLLGPLQDNGGPTETHALLDGSPAIDACVGNCIVNEDQRGIGRPQYDHCDIGAYEVREPPVQRAPAVSLWGTVGLAVVMAGLLVWLARRRMLLKNGVK